MQNINPYIYIFFFFFLPDHKIETGLLLTIAALLIKVEFREDKIRKKTYNFNSQEEIQLCVQCINCLENDILEKNEVLFA